MPPEQPHPEARSGTRPVIGLAAVLTVVGSLTLLGCSLVLAALMTGVLDSTDLRWWRERSPDAHDALRPPIVIFDLARAVRAGVDLQAQRTLADRLASQGVLVLDSQAVLAAPAGLYLAPRDEP